ncbi:serpin family protein [Azotosporobacter soli]|uniref:serpin family protein n=1 Tax=Azotosporobacter soli TaxID=3055040 RepID=UPI0031FE6F67
MKRWKRIVILVLLLIAALVLCREALAAPLQEAAGGSNAFAWDFYQIARKNEPDKNLVFSPYAISRTLAMAYAGSGGETARQLEKTLHVTLEPKALTEAFGKLHKELPLKDNAANRLRMGDAMWLDSAVTVRREFSTLMDRNYPRSLRDSDFVDHGEAARQAVNFWLEDKTDGAVTTFLPPEDAKKAVSLLLVNGDSFKGEWQTPFMAKDMEQLSFRRVRGDSLLVPMLHQKLEAPYFEDEHAQVVELPYAGNELATLVVVPKGEGKEAIDELDLGKYTSGQKLLHSKALDVFLPKCKVESRYSLEDAALLPALGLTTAFDAKSADFSGVSSKQTLFISRMLQQAVVDIAENGAQTQKQATLPAGKTNAGHSSQPALAVRADHPFFFLIVHKPSGLILFMGRIVDPTQAGLTLWQAEMANYPGHVEQDGRPVMRPGYPYYWHWRQ